MSFVRQVLSPTCLLYKKPLHVCDITSNKKVSPKVSLLYSPTSLLYILCTPAPLKLPLACSHLPRYSVVKNPPANAWDVGSIPGSGRSPRGRNGNPLQCSCQENRMGRRAWQATVHGVADSHTTEQLSTHARTCFSIHKSKCLFDWNTQPSSFIVPPLPPGEESLDLEMEPLSKGNS